MVYHLQIISAMVPKNPRNTKSRHINIELDNDYQSIKDIEDQINQKFHKKITDLTSINKNEYVYNDINEEQRSCDYLIRIEERGLN